MRPPKVPGARPGFADRFELKSQAGTGGMGTVYQAIDRETGLVVALKILHGKGVTDAARFDQEAAMLAELRHPGIVRYIDHGVTSHGESYIAMEWLQGETLETRLLRGPLPPAAVARLAQRVLAALGAAHERGIVHRDVKPSNIFLVGWRPEDIRMLDFGIARRVFDPKRFTKAGSTVGTPLYAAPEQARGDRDVDARADIFSLGCVLFESLVGEPPWTGDTPMEVMAKICMGAPPRLGSRRPGLPPDLERLVEQMLAQDRRQRPPDASRLAGAFDSVAASLGPAEEEPPQVVRSQIGEAEQRVMCALVIRCGAPARGERLPARRIFPWQGATAVLATAEPPAETAEIARVIAPFGGQVDRLLDRSLLVTLGGKVALGDQAAQLARCALALQARLPGAALALAAGRAALLARLPVGPLVARVASLAEEAAPGRVALDALAARLLPARFRKAATGDRLYLVGETDEDERPRAVRGRVGPFVGRDRELGTLRALYEEVVEEQVARAALVLGGAGLGKTRLRQELLAAIAKNDPAPLVLETAGEGTAEPGRFPLLGRVLARAGVDPAEDRPAADVQEAFVGWLGARCAHSPVLLVLDDLHRADAACLGLVDAALRSLRDQPLFVLGLARPELDQQFPSLWADRSVERLRLPPLGRRAGQLLLQHLVPDASPEVEAFALERWEGNPFFLEELAEAALDGRPVTPDTVLGLVETRFEDLEAESRRVLRAASLFGEEPVPAEAVAALLGGRSRRELGERLDALVARDLLERCLDEGQVLYRFRSRLLREAVYRTLPAGDRALGRRLARAFIADAGRAMPAALDLPVSQSTALAAAG